MCESPIDDARAEYDNQPVTIHSKDHNLKSSLKNKARAAARRKAARDKADGGEEEQTVRLSNPAAALCTKVGQAETPRAPLCRSRRWRW